MIEKKKCGPARATQKRAGRKHAAPKGGGEYSKALQQHMLAMCRVEGTDVTYEETPEGAAIVFTGKNPDEVRRLADKMTELVARHSAERAEDALKTIELLGSPLNAAPAAGPVVPTSGRSGGGTPRALTAVDTDEIRQLCSDAVRAQCCGIFRIEPTPLGARVIMTPDLAALRDAMAKRAALLRAGRFDR